MARNGITWLPAGAERRRRRPISLPVQRTSRRRSECFESHQPEMAWVHSSGVDHAAICASVVSLPWIIPPCLFSTDVFVYRRETPSSAHGWFALSSTALGRTAVEAKDGYSVLVLPSVSSSQMSEKQVADEASKDGRRSVCWEFVGASVLDN